MHGLSCLFKGGLQCHVEPSVAFASGCLRLICAAGSGCAAGLWGLCAAAWGFGRRSRPVFFVPVPRSGGAHAQGDGVHKLSPYRARASSGGGLHRHCIPRKKHSFPGQSWSCLGQSRAAHSGDGVLVGPGAPRQGARGHIGGRMRMDRTASHLCPAMPAASLAFYLAGAGRFSSCQHNTFRRSSL